MTRSPEAKRYKSPRVPLGDAVERIAVAYELSMEAAWRDLVFPALRDGALSADGVLFPDGIQTLARPLVRCQALKPIPPEWWMEAQFGSGQLQSPFGFNEAIAPRMEGTTVDEADLARLWPAVASTVATGQTRPTTAQRYTPAKAREWYRQWVADHRAAGTIPSREEDWRVALEQPGLEGIPRGQVRKLRREEAPTDWKRPGKRKGQHPGPR